MALNLFGAKPISIFKIAGTEMMFSSLFLNSAFMAGYKDAAYTQSLSCRGSYIKASYLGLSQNTIRSVSGEEVLFQSDLVNGTNGLSTYSRDTRVLDAYDNEYNGVIVHPEGLPSNPTAFASILRSPISHWKGKGKKGIWLKLPITKSDLVPIAVKEGFQYHHAERDYVMMTYWISQEPCILPPNATHQVGVGGFVLNDRDEVLVVQEKYIDSG